MGQWSKRQSSLAGEAEVNAVVKGISQGVELLELFREMLSSLRPMDICVDAITCQMDVTQDRSRTN